MSGRRSTLVWLILAAAGVDQSLGQSSGGDFAVTRQVVAGGGSAAAGGDFTAITTAGQPSVDRATGGEFAVRGGFHAPADVTDDLFSDGFEGAKP